MIPDIQVGDAVHLPDQPKNSPDEGTVRRVTARSKMVLVIFPICVRVWIPKSALSWALGSRKYRVGKWNVSKEWAHAPKAKCNACGSTSLRHRAGVDSGEYTCRKCGERGTVSL